jgi:hypothetical protein
MVRGAIRKLGVGSYRFRLDAGALHRPHYAYILYQAAQLAARLGEPRISVIEFGVAGGGGLLWMERHAVEVEKLFPTVKIELYGFDTGGGLPAPRDYRDLPYHWKSGFFAMDPAALKAKLTRAKLVIGDAVETSKTFFADFNPAPIGAISHDLDFYSSTRPALDMFLAESRFLLPRIFCYFDDTIGGEVELYNDFTGERLAIEDFNRDNETVKIAPPHYLRVLDGGQLWRHQIWIAHCFEHPNYNKFVSAENQQLPI